MAHKQVYLTMPMTFHRHSVTTDIHHLSPLRNRSACSSIRLFFQISISKQNQVSRGEQLELADSGLLGNRLRGSVKSCGSLSCVDNALSHKLHCGRWHIGSRSHSNPNTPMPWAVRSKRESSPISGFPFQVSERLRFTRSWRSSPREISSV